MQDLNEFLTFPPSAQFRHFRGAIRQAIEHPSKVGAIFCLLMASHIHAINYVL